MSDPLRYASGRDGLSRPLPELEPALAERAARLLAGTVGSLHDHPVRFPEPLTAENWDRHMAAGVDVLAVEELQASGLGTVVANCFSQPELGFVRGWAASMREQIAAASGLHLVRTAVDLGGAGTGILLGLEDLGPIATLDDLDLLFADGVRVAGVAYNTGSLLGCGLAQDDTGLTAFGRAAIARMNELGMVLDVSHAGDRTSLEAIAASERPAVISHAGAQGVWNSSRMIPDSVIVAAAQSGGMIGIEAAPGSTRVDLTRADHTLDDVVRHIEYCVDLVGVDHVGLGADTFYGDHVGLYRALGSKGAALPEGAVAFEGDLVAGAENPTEFAPQVCHALLLAGWADADVAKILGGNLDRVLRAALPVSA